MIREIPASRSNSWPATPVRHHLYDLVTTVSADARLVTSKHPDVRVCELAADAVVRIRRIRATTSA